MSGSNKLLIVDGPSLYRTGRYLKKTIWLPYLATHLDIAKTIVTLQGQENNKGTESFLYTLKNNNIEYKMFNPESKDAYKLEIATMCLESNQKTLLFSSDLSFISFCALKNIPIITIKGITTAQFNIEMLNYVNNIRHIEIDSDIVIDH
jgi:hypothetical protein